MTWFGEGAPVPRPHRPKIGGRNRLLQGFVGGLSSCATHRLGALANGGEGGDDIAIAEGRTIADGRSAISAAFEPGSRVELDVPDGKALEVTCRLIRRGGPVRAIAPC